MTRLPSLLDQCFDEAVGHAAPMLGRCVDVAVAALQAEEQGLRDLPARDRAARAWYALLRHRNGWGPHLAQRLKAAFQASESEGNTSSLALLSNSDLLALVDDSAVAESIESAKLLQKLLPEVEQALAVLDARMSSLIGLDTIHAEKNPLRPSVYVRVLRETLGATESDGEVRALWMRHLAPPLGRELRGLYEQLAERLQRANVQEAGYRVRLVADPQASRAAPPKRDLLDFGFGAGGMPTEPGPAAEPGFLPPMRELARAHPRLDHDLMQQFLQHGGEPYQQPLDESYYRQLDRELAAIQNEAALPVLDEVVLEAERTQFRDLPVVDRPARRVGVGSQLKPQEWGDFASAVARSRALLELKRQARSVGQAVGLDVVRKLVHQVARDPLLLAPVREAVVALEPALLNQAITQPRYFNEDAHPARRLVESVAQRSFRYNDEFSSEFESFFGPVREAFRTLNQRASQQPEAFGEALEQLRGRWRTQDQREQQQHQDRLQALRHAEQRQALADRIAWDLSQRPDVDNAPGFILDFIYGSWALVLAQAEMGLPASQEALNSYRKAVSELLWSIRKEVTLRRPAELFRTVPGLIRTLREGLAALGKTPEETQPFFDALMRLHQPVLGLRRAKVRSDSGQAGEAPPPAWEDPTQLDELAPATPEQRLPKAAAQPWLGREELAQAGFEATQIQVLSGIGPQGAGAGASGEGEGIEGAEGSDPGDSGATPLAAQADGAHAELDPAEQVLLTLSEGSWVDLHAHGEWHRAQLIWASSRGTLFMFTSRGGRAHSMTKRVCMRLVRKQWLRPVEMRPVVQRALDEVLAAEAAPERAPASVY